MNSERIARNPLLTSYDSISIIGCGGIGSWIAILLGLSGQVKKLYLHEFDIVSPSNRNRCLFPRESDGKNKAEVLRDIILSIVEEDEIEIVIATSMFDEGSLVLGDIIIDCTDRTETQKIIVRKCRNTGKRLFRAGSDANHFSVKEVNTDVDDDWMEETSGYETVPSWAGSAVLPAVLLCLKILNDQEGSLDHEELGAIFSKINSFNAIDKIDITDTDGEIIRIQEARRANPQPDEIIVTRDPTVDRTTRVGIPTIQITPNVITGTGETTDE